jgi:hypothetical protein
MAEEKQIYFKLFFFRSELRHTPKCFIGFELEFELNKRKEFIYKTPEIT